MKTPIANPMQTAVTPAHAARICGLSTGTINRCFDRGLLKGYKVPGSKFRRIPLKNLYQFVREYGLPCEEANPQSAVDAEHVDAFMRLFGIKNPRGREDAQPGDECVTKASRT